MLATRCTIITQSGRRCTRKCLDFSFTCWQHTDSEPMNSINNMNTMNNINTISEPLTNDVSELQDCSICMESMPLNRSVRLEKCGHTFCRHCIYEWICSSNNSCPYCRQNINIVERLHANQFGIALGMMSSIYITEYDITRMPEHNRNIFLFFYSIVVNELGLNEKFTKRYVTVSDFNKVMLELTKTHQESVDVFINKSATIQYSAGYTKTSTYSEILEGKNPINNINYVRNLLY